MSFSLRSLGAALLLSLGAGCTCGIFDPATTRFACSTDADCGDGFTCKTVDNAKECVASSASGGDNGASCSLGGDCASGFCVGGLCCENSCTGECESCSVSGSRGRCVPKAGGTTCGTNYVCSGQSGTCPTSCTGIGQCSSARDCVNGACVDIDECMTSGICGANASCTDIPGSWQCTCATGFMGAMTTGGPATCMDVDECAASPDCGPLAVCANTQGSYECRCPAGTFGATVTGGPTSCSTVDRCTLPGMCGANATCASTSTSYSCTCNAGYSGTTTMGGPATCTDTNECTATSNACGANANCTNTTGSYQCACASGFGGSATTGMPATCTDIDECPGRNCGTNAHCTNTPGSFTCSCDTGFVGSAVDGGTATCTVMDYCTGVNCGANASCTSGATNFTCSCSAGYQGTPVSGGPATCTDINECGAIGPGCGANTICTNTSGSYSCACQPGFTGPMTTGMPTTCVAGPTRLGVAQGPGTQIIPITQSVAAGTKIALVVLATSTAFTVTDSKNNTWTRLVTDNSCGTCGTVNLYTATLASSWGPGDTVTITGSSSTLTSSWLSALTGFPFFDLSGTYSMNGSTLTPTVSTTAAVTDPDEYVIAAFSTRNAIALSSPPDGGFTTELAPMDPQLSGIIASKIGSGLTGVQSYTANAAPAERFSGFVATFYGGMQLPPTNLSLSHTPNNRSFTVSWTAGRGNGGGTGCAVQFRNSTGSWVTVQNTSCDTDAVARTVNLPAGANWYGASWSSVQVRVMRNSDQVVLGAFLTPLTCSNRAASSTPTPTVDENCDSTWDDHTCLIFGWTIGTQYASPYTACTNVTDTTATKACNSTNEAETRYTEGMGTQSPAVVFSSSNFGSGCTGPQTGATTWTCTGSNCTYR